MRTELQSVIPRDKHDIARANAAVALGWPAVEPIAPELLKWLQDINWPVARPLAEFFAGIGTPLLPYVQQVLEANDHVWKYYVLEYVVSQSPELTLGLHTALKRLALQPTPKEHDEGLHKLSRSAKIS